MKISKSIIIYLLILFLQSGISDNELEDILSLDDNVLNSIYEDQIPEVRRVPAILVMKIKVSRSICVFFLDQA